MALGSHMPDLGGMPCVPLLNGDTQQHPRVPHLAGPGGLNTLNPGLLKRLLEQARAQYRSVAGNFIRWPLRWTSQHDGFVPVINGLDIHIRFVAKTAAIVPGPFAKGTFRFSLFRVYIPFQNNLGIGGYWQPCHFSFDDLVGLAP